jgi:pyruvate dehydrogenase E2 component (dihydrolipoamide acetyltransferase)
MTRWEFKLPDIGEGVAEGEIVAWADGIAEGVVVQADQALAEVMTDKATVTITSPKTGRIVELGGKAGQVIAVGANLVVLDLDGGAAAAPAPAEANAPEPVAPAAEPKKESGNAATAVGDIKEDLPGMNRSPAPAARKAPEAAVSAYFVDKPLATPATRKLARDLGVDLRTVPPTGPHNRVTKDDVRARLATPSTAVTPASPQVTTATTSAAPVDSAAPRFTPMKIAAASAEETALETREPLRGVRKKIFDSMSRSKHTAAHFTFVEECDVTALKDLRARLRPGAEKEGVKLTYLPFIVKATVAALKRHPELNSAFDESTQEIVRRAYINIGIASSTESGLIVPVVKGADRRSILDTAREIQRLGEATKAGKVKAADLQGSTFTVTSLGQQGGLFATPILNFPEVGILGVHQIKQKPVVRDGQIVIGEVMLLSLSFDHRIIDGHVGAAFAYEIIRYLENPDALFLEMA